MAQETWTSTTSGNWSTGNNWSGGAVPTASDTAFIGVASVTVSITAANAACESLTTTLSTLDIAGGTLTVSNGATIAGAFEQTVGAFIVQAGVTTFADGATLSGGLLESASLSTTQSALDISGGTLSVSSGATIGGAYDQIGGTFDVASGTTAFEDGGTLTGGLLSVASLDASQSPLDISGGTLTASSGATITGAYVQSAGTAIIESGNTIFNGGIALSGGLLKDVGPFFTSGGTYSQSGGTLVLSGTGGTFNNNLVETAGLIDMLSGTLGLAGAVTTLDGTVSGNGTLLVEGELNGLNGTTTIGKTTDLAIGKLSVTSGVLALSQSGSSYSYTYTGYLTATGGTVALGSNTLDLTGPAELADQISGAGTVIAKGVSQLEDLTLNNAVVLDIDSSATLEPFQNGPGQVTLENNSKITIAAGATLSLTGNDSILDSTYNSTLVDDGTLSRVGGTGTAEIVPSFTEAANATLNIASGVLDFSGATVSLLGTITGAGTLSLGGDNTGQPQNFSFGSGIVLDAGEFWLSGPTDTSNQFILSSSLTFAGDWVQSGGLFLMEGTDPVLDLTGSVLLDGGVIKTSTGTINTTGTVSLGNSVNYPLGVDIEGFTDFVVNDIVRQAASIQLGAQSGSKPTAVIAAGGAWQLEDAAGITGPYGTVINEGTLEKTVGSGVSNVDGTLLNTGTLDVAASEMLLDGSGTLGGTVTGGGQLDLEGNGIYTLSSGLSLTVAHVLVDNTPFGPDACVVSLSSNLTYAGVWAQHGGNVQLNSDTLTLSGTSVLDGGTLTGPGVLTASGSLTIGNSPNSIYTIGSQAELNITKTAEQSVSLTVSSLADLNVSSAATYTIDDSATIFGNGSLTVAGALFSSGGGTTTIDPSVTITGKISALEGTLAFLGSVGGTGSVFAHPGTQLDFDGAVSSSTTINLEDGNSGLLIGDAPAFGGLIGDFTTGDSIEIAQLASGVIKTSLSSNGETLTISDSSNHTFTLSFNTAQSLTGTHALIVSDGSNGYIGIYHS